MISLRRFAAPLLLALLAAPPAGGAVDPAALELQRRAIALLENEQPAEAEPLLRELVERVPGDPLPAANLAIALLRQQENEAALEWIDRALDEAPGRPDLLALRGEILQWMGRTDEAIEVLHRAATAAPDDLEVQHALYRLATSHGRTGPAAEALERLARLRPDNVVVMLARGQRAIAEGDRAAASAAFLRVRELAWGAPPMAEPVIESAIEALESGDVAAARVPALRLENVLKVTPMYQQGLRELSLGIQGVPLQRFEEEPPTTELGEPLDVRFAATRLDDAAVAGGALAAADLDGDGDPEIARVAAGDEGGAVLVVGHGEDADERPLPGAADGWSGLLVTDLDNDGHLDLLPHGAGGLAVVRGGTEGGEVGAELGLAEAAATAAEVIDFDIEGDLDLVLAAGGDLELYRNALAGALEPVGDRALPELDLGAVHRVVASDLDRDGDLDLVVAHDGGLAWLDNLRQGELAERTAEGGLAGAPPARAVVSADLDGDGWPDLVAAGRGLTFLRNAGGRFEPWAIGDAFRTSAELADLVAFDADNDGRLDLAVAGPGGVVVLAQDGDGGFRFLPVEEGPAAATALAATDLDGDGDLDLLAGGPEGLHRLENLGGDANHWLSVRLRGLTKGNSKNNLFGVGSTVELFRGAAYQFREARGDVTHLGLGAEPTADVLRVTWTNGVPQNRLDLGGDATITEEQVLKGSCPFLYAWDGEEIAFVTDLLWGSPLGLPVAEGVWAGADPSELVAVPGARPTADGRYDLRVTEELWEAAFFDHARLWVVDHPAEVEVASALRVLPGEATPEEVRGTRGLRPVAAAWDAAGRRVDERVRRRDEVYADGWRPSSYQGVAAEEWRFVVDLGEAPASPVRLHLDGWIFPSDASLNLALDQRGLAAAPPRLEVETADGWEVLMERMGFPAGKTKTMVVDTPPLPDGARRLAVVGSQWLSWDRIAWSTEPADDAPRVVARLDPSRAELRFRGFSALVRRAPNAPHAFDWSRVSEESPWLPFPGRYTRYGDVAELLAAPDDRSVILAPGDEMALAFDAAELPPPPEGWRRTVFLESHGWDKDADRNTWRAQRVGPLPFRAMSGYPYGPGEAFPDTPEHREYVEEWLTRVVEPYPPAPRDPVADVPTPAPAPDTR